MDASSSAVPSVSLRVLLFVALPLLAESAGCRRAIVSAQTSRPRLSLRTMDRLAMKLNRGNRLVLHADRRSPYETADSSATPTRRSPYDSQGGATEAPKRTAPPKTSPFDSFTPSARDEIVQASRYEGGSSKDPEGFWENTGRYIRYFFSVNFGIIISIGTTCTNVRPCAARFVRDKSIDSLAFPVGAE
eukprot:jgi/Bigna1/84627/fgenesh1_pg.179_\